MKKLVLILMFALSTVCFSQSFTTVTFTIPANDSLSNIIDIQNYIPVSLVMPSQWTTAQITFKTGPSSVYNYNDMDGNEIILEPFVGKTIQIKPQIWYGFGRYLQIKSGTSSASVAQAQARIVTLILRGI